MSPSTFDVAPSLWRLKRHGPLGHSSHSRPFLVVASFSNPHLASGELMAALPGHTSYVKQIAFSPTGDVLLS